MLDETNRSPLDDAPNSRGSGAVPTWLTAFVHTGLDVGRDVGCDSKNTNYHDLCKSGCTAWHIVASRLWLPRGRDSE